MSNQHLFSLIKHPFYVDAINSSLLEGEVDSFYSDFQEALKLTDEQADALDDQTNLTNFECRDNKGKRVVFTIAQNAEITSANKGEFTTTDIFGNPLVFTVTKVKEAPTLDDILAYHADPVNFIPAHQDFLKWIETHKGAINQLIDVSFRVSDEYRKSHDDDYLLFRGDLQVDFQINKKKFDIVLPYFLAIKEVDGALVLDRDPLDISRDDYESYQSILSDVNELPHEEFKAIVEKVDAAFDQYFCLSSVPSWEERLLKSFKHDDILDILKEEKKQSQNV